MPELSQAMIRTFANLVYYKTTEFSIDDVPISYRQAVTDLLTTYGEDPYFDDHRHHIADVDGLQTELDGKVIKVAGKGLSANDYTTAEKEKLAGLENFSGSYTDLTDAPELFSGSYTDLTDKPTIPEAVTLNNTVTSKSTTQAATANSVKTAYDRAQEAFTSASNGKTLIANAITGKGTPANPDDSFAALATAIGSIATGKKVAVRTVNVPANSTDRVVVTDLDFTPRIVFGVFTGTNNRMFSASSDGSLPNKVIYDSSFEVVTFTPNTSGFVVSVGSGTRFYGEYKIVAVE